MENENNSGKNQYIKWLPTTPKEAKWRGWDELDVILFTGDAYVDHPSFGAAVIGRLLEKNGLRVAIVPQPNWRDDLRDFKKFGVPKLFFGVTSGSMDSMVNHYTANLRLRSDDAFTPGNKSGFRPDYATTVYSNILKKLYPDIPVIIGGIEASMRRLCHYDYWSNSLMPSVLVSSKADLLVYGMGEKPIIEIARLLKKGVPIPSLKNIAQTAYCTSKNEIPVVKNWNSIQLFSFEECLKDKLKYAQNFKTFEIESNSYSNNRLIENNLDKVVVVNPPYELSTTNEIDQSFDLPFTRLPHPRYKGKNIPAWEMIKFSVNIHRGCFGGCSFCAIAAHQGKNVISRSEKSILAEIDKIKEIDGFAGYLSDVGGPSANMYQMEGKDKNVCKKCQRPSCIYPGVCKNLNSSPEKIIALYKKINSLKGIKKAFVGSGIRYDIMFDQNKKLINEWNLYLELLLKHHVSGRLKVAPEHTENEVLIQMRKPGFMHFRNFKKEFDRINQNHLLNLQLIPYFISSHPASKLEHMAKLALETKSLHFKLEQVQDFTPTPMTLSTCIFYTGIDPYTLKKVYVPVKKEEKENQKSFFFWYKKEYRTGIKNLLKKIGKEELFEKLIGSK
mgnify:CR=1 FL=1